MPVRTVIERGTHGKRAVAFVLDWPGWSRGAKSPELAMEVLEAYRSRYRPIAALAGMAPRGGGRDRDRIIRHTIRAESEDMARKVGLRIPEGGALGDALPGYRDDFVDAMRAYQRGDTKGRMSSRTLPFLVRHGAFHTLDHAWEMEDKDLTREPVG